MRFVLDWGHDNSAKPHSQKVFGDVGGGNSEAASCLGKASRSALV